MSRVLGLVLIVVVVATAFTESKRVSAANDTVTPALVSVSLGSPGPFSPPDSISVAFEATDDLNVRFVVLAFESPTGQIVAIQKFSNVTGVQAVPPATRNLVNSTADQIDYSFLPSGTYTLVSVDVADWSLPQLNSIACFRDGSAVANPVTSTLPPNPCPSVAALAALDFVIVNPNGDSAAPELTSITLPTGTFQPGESASVQLAADDNGGSGVSSMFFSWTLQGNGAKTIEGNLDQAAGTATVNINQNTAPGTYQFSGIIVRDRLQNSLTYQADGSLQKVPAGISAPTAPHAFIAAMSVTFTVVNPNADTSTPVLNSFERTSPQLIGPGANVTLEFNATDGLGSGLSEIYFDYDSPIALGFIVFSLNASGSGGQVSSQLFPGYPPGSYLLFSIRVIDEDGNEVRYFRGGQTAGLPQGVTFPPTQPAGFAAMFAQADFIAGSAPGINLATISPRSAQANSGQSFTLVVTGTGFSAQSVVFFGAASLATLSLEGTTVIRANVPGALLNSAPGFVPIAVTNPNAFAPNGAPAASTIAFEITEYAAADVNADTCLDVRDALAVRQHVASIAVTQVPCAAAGPTNFDANRSGSATSEDALYVLQVLAGVFPR